MARLNRYRLYFWLMDATTVLTLLGLASAFLDPASLHSRPADGSFWRVAVGSLSAFLAFFLIFAGRLRDEFAETCWQSATAVTVKGLVVLPMMTLLASGVVHGFVDAGRAAEGLPPIGNVHPLQLVDGLTVFSWFWALMLSLFVCAFQWFRWRGSR